MQVKIMRSLLKNVIERSSLLKLRCKSGQDSHHLPHPTPPLHLPPPPSPQQKKKNCVCNYGNSIKFVNFGKHFHTVSLFVHIIVCMQYG